MRAAPHPNDPSDEDSDAPVVDPLSDETLDLWSGTARRNREVFEEVFRTVPSNVVRDFKAYDVCPFLSLCFMIWNLISLVFSLW